MLEVHRPGAALVNNGFDGIAVKKGGVDGLKTGWTVASGYNIIVTARRGKTRLLVVVMGGRSRAARDMVAHSLIEAGFKAPASPQQVRKRMRGVL